MNNLVKKLRKSSNEERRNIAIELAQSGTDEAIKELIRMIEGRRRHLMSWYKFDDQLLGIECLGMTTSREALEYLQKLLIEKIETRTIHWTDRQENEWDTEGHTITYPNARKKLRKLLNYQEGDFSPYGLNVEHIERSRSEESEKLYRQITLTITTLETKLSTLKE